MKSSVQTIFYDNSCSGKKSTSARQQCHVEGVDVEFVHGLRVDLLVVRLAPLLLSLPAPLGLRGWLVATVRAVPVKLGNHSTNRITT